MASLITSSDSDQYSNGGRHRRHKVEELAATLKDTNRNLRAVDRMLDDYKDIGDQQTSAMDKLRDDIERTSDQLKDERMKKSGRSAGQRSQRAAEPRESHSSGAQRRTPTSPLKDYERCSSDREYTDDFRQRKSRGAVRFFDDMDGVDHLHDLHETVRDVSSDQLRLHDDLNSEVERRNRWEVEHKRVLQSVAKQPVVEQAMSSVDMRLQSIQDEIRSERLSMRKRQDEVSKMSSELKQALDSQKQVPAPTPPAYMEDTKLLHNRLSQSETGREMVESELEKARRKLDQSQGAREALVRQVDDLRQQLHSSEEDRQRLKSHVDQQEKDFQQRRKQLSLGEQDRDHRDREQLHLQEEVRALQGQLTKSTSIMGDYAELRRVADKSERQRAQLSDHIEVLNKDLENKEKQSAKVINQLQALSEKYDECQGQRRQSLLQLEDALKKLRNTTHSAESLATELKDTQAQLKESDQRKEEIKLRAQETVRQWKVKSKKLEREADRFKHSTQQATGRHEQLIKELEMTKSHHMNSGQQLEHLKREFSELLAIRAQQDEQVRLKDIQVNELKSLKMDLEKDLRDSKMVIERMEHELHSSRDKHQAVMEERNRMEDHLAAMETSTHITHNQIQQLQKELREASLVKVDITAQLADSANDRRELKAGMEEARKSEAAAREELGVAMKRFKEEKEFDHHRLDSLHNELSSYKNHESQRVQELSRRFKKERAEYEAELQAIKIELEEERSSIKLFKKQQEQLKAEIDRLNGELSRSQEETSQFQQKYQQAKEQLITKSHLSEDGLSRAKEVELELLDAKEAVMKVTKDYQNILHTVMADLDGALETTVGQEAAAETLKTPGLPRATPMEPQAWLAEVRNKLDWLRTELQEQREKAAWMKTNMTDAVINGDRDRQLLIAQIERQNNALDQMASMQKLDSSGRPVSNVKEDEKDNKRRQTGAGTKSPLNGEVVKEQMDLDELIKETQKEREKIHERYSKLRETMHSLRQELTDTKLFTEINEANHPPQRKLNPRVKLPPEGSCVDSQDEKRVQFDRTPTQSVMRSMTPIARSRKGWPQGITEVVESDPEQDGEEEEKEEDDEEEEEVEYGKERTSNSRKNAPPLTLTDEEFASRFLPRSPPLIGGQNFSDDDDDSVL